MQQLHIAEPIVYWMKNREEERSKEEKKGRWKLRYAAFKLWEEATGDKEPSNPSPVPDMHANWFKNRTEVEKEQGKNLYNRIPGALWL